MPLIDLPLMDLPPGISIADSTAGADWLGGRDGVRTWGPVGDAFPSQFTQFARVLHPSSRRDYPYPPVTWHEAFAARGRALTADVSWFRDIGDHNDAEFQEPEDNSLPQPEATLVASTLLGHTTTPDDCWFVWSPVRGLPFGTGVPLLRVRNGFDRWRVRRAGMKRSREAWRLERSLPSVGGGVVLRGSLTPLIAASPTMVPSVWWPADHA